VHCKLVQCRYRHTVFTAHRLSPTNEAPLQMAPPHYTHTPRDNLKDDLEKASIDATNGAGLGSVAVLTG